jgi:hypothetical protein
MNSSTLQIKWNLEDEQEEVRDIDSGEKRGGRKSMELKCSNSVKYLGVRVAVDRKE